MPIQITRPVKNLESRRRESFLLYTSVHSHEQFMIPVHGSYALSLCEAKQRSLCVCVCLRSDCKTRDFPG